MDYIKSFGFSRKSLDEQYVKAWHNEEAFARFAVLRKETEAYADSLAGKPHPVIKALCFAHLCEEAPIYVNPDDLFGICLEAQKMDPIFDIGCHYGKMLQFLPQKWEKELSDVLYKPEDKDFCEGARNYLLNEFYIDYNHSVPCWEDVFSLGLGGILGRVEKYRASFAEKGELTREREAYFDGMEITYRAILKLFSRYAEKLSGYGTEEAGMMRKALLALENRPPENMYEALMLSWQFWFLEENIDLVRARTIGGIDELYRRFYEHDLQNGVFTKDEITGLLVYFMNAFNAFRVAYQQPMYVGGRDRTGKCVVNELSYVVLDAYNILSAPNPKLQAKISGNTPEAFLLRVAETIRNGNSSISVINDEVAEKSLLKLGATGEEARTCLMAGCWDYTVKNHEVKTIPIRVSLPKILEYTMNGGKCTVTGKQVGMHTGAPDSFGTFEEFYAAFERQFTYIFERCRRIIENWELYLDVLSPSNMFSATHTDSLSKGVDGYARGMKYNTTVFTVAGVASLVDSLCAVKKYVFDKKEITLSELNSVLSGNWEGAGLLRKKILADKDKYGSGSSLADGLTVRVTKFFARTVNGVPNSRGSFWKLGTLSIDKNVRFGAIAGASPDGRLAGEPFSKNLSAVVGMDRNGVTGFLDSVSKIDFSDFPHAGIADVLLHPSAVSGKEGLEAFAGLIRGYFAKGGHSIQFNIFDAETLKKAQKEPDKYRTLQIRVCGWNVYFVDLEKVLQDAFIAQAEHYEGL